MYFGFSCYMCILVSQSVSQSVSGLGVDFGHGPNMTTSGQREPFTAFSYTGSPKTEQGGDNQARHVVSKLMNPESAC